MIGRLIKVDMAENNEVQVYYVTDSDSYDIISFAANSAKRARTIHDYWSALLEFGDMHLIDELEDEDY